MRRAARARSDEVLPGTRALALLILPFLAVASVILYVVPSRTEPLFSWTITPNLSAMFLACAYIGGIWFFSRVLRARRWHELQYGFVAVLVFAAGAGIATLIHHDRFHYWSAPTIAWVALYALTPFLVAAVLWTNWPADTREREQGDVTLPRPVRIVGAAIGGAALLLGGVAFAAPMALAPVWAWELTPLTGRIIGVVLTLPGMVNLWLLRDSRWSAFRVIVQAEIVSLVFIAGALAIARDDLLWQRPAAGIFVAGILLSLLLFAGSYTWLERRRMAVRSPNPPSELPASTR